MKRTAPLYAAVAALTALTVACADSPTAVMPPVDGPNLAIIPNIIVGTSLQMFEEKVAVCKVFTGSQLSYPAANFSAVFTGTFNETVSFTLRDGYCADLGFFGGSGVSVTVTEAVIPNYSTSWTRQYFTRGPLDPATIVGSISAPTAGYVATGAAYGFPAPGTGTKFVFTNAYVPPPGCTLTQGYWKTHSLAGPAPYDATWALLPGGLGHNTVFFLSGRTWLQVFLTAPAGNAYYTLAHQYMAARLNVLNGASTSAAVASAISSASTLFGARTPAQIGALNGGNALRQQFIALAGVLGNYNEGITGPGHCGA